MKTREREHQRFHRKVTTLKVVIKGKIGKHESQERLVDHSFEYYTNSVNICVVESTKMKSPPRLVDEHVIPHTDLIQEGVGLLNMLLEDYLKQSNSAKATQGAEGANVEKETERTAENVEADGVKERLVEGFVHTDSSATESHEFDPTKIAPTSNVSGKQKLKRSPKKKKDFDEEGIHMCQHQKKRRRS
ncbi:hypothetical protein Hanom_Chr04g00328661 [Helianthus anomalus]